MKAVNLKKLISQSESEHKKLSVKDFNSFLALNRDLLLGDTFDGCWGAEVVFPSEGVCVVTSDVRVQVTYKIDGLKLDEEVISRKALLINKESADECIRKIKSRGKKS